MVEYRDELVARCAPEATHYAKLIMSCIYVMVLIALTFIFSMATWDSEENHNESRFVFFVSCFTIVIWIVWTIVATMAEIKYQDPAVIIANLANATVIPSAGVCAEDVPAAEVREGHQGGEEVEDVVSL